jgi:hypothetical protein
MSEHAYGWIYLSQAIVQRLTLASILGLAFAAAAWTVGAIVGAAPWLELEIALAGREPFDGGIAVQVVTTLLLVGLCFFVPAHDRVARLERSHRDFRVSMADVARAYQAAHAADRDGVFRMKSEFDSVRERLVYLRSHPDLGSLEPDILELAAQMSHESRELAEIYSDENVERARRFLQERQEEAEQMKARIQSAHTTCREMKRWLDGVELEEDVVRSRLAALREELADLLPDLGLVERPPAATEFPAIRRISAE